MIFLRKHVLVVAMVCNSTKWLHQVMHQNTLFWKNHNLCQLIYGSRCWIPLPLPPLGHRTATAHMAFFPSFLFAPLHPAHSPSLLGTNLALRGPLSGSLASSGGRGRAQLHMSLAGPFSHAAPGLGNFPFPLGSSKVFLHFQALHISHVPNQINHSHSCASFEEASCLHLVR